MDSKTITSTICGGLGMIFSMQITQEVLNVVLTILSILSILISLAISIINWWKKAKSDGKIDTDELGELKDIVDKTAEELKDDKDNKRDS